jgi:hypothetical protein
VISEPELSDGGDGDRPVDVVSDFDDRPRRVRTGRRPWTWAVGGIVLASAVWGGVLAVSHAWPDHHPDLHGYQLTGSPCESAAVQPLTEAVKASATARSPKTVTVTSGPGPAEFHRGTAVDEVKCSVITTAPFNQGGSVQYSADIAVVLHKKTDPRAEFEDERQLYDSSLVPVDSIAFIPHLGDSAYLLTPSEQTKQLKVLQGGAVITISLTADDGYNVSADDMNALHTPSHPATDLMEFHSALIQTARDLMTTMRQR